MSPGLRYLFLGLSLLVLASCGDGGGGGPTTPGPVPPPLSTAMTPVTATALLGEVGGGVIVSVRVSSASSAPVPNVTVTFSITRGAGSVAASAVITDATGLASTAWTLGTRVGENRLAATLGQLPSVEFVANARAAPPTALGIRTQPAGARAGAALVSQPAIEIVDRFGNLVSDASSVVTVRLAPGTGGLMGATAVSAVGGVAGFSDLALVGPVGERALQFTAPDLQVVTSDSFILLPPARSEADRTDDVSGPQGHVIYVVPSDGTDRSLDTETLLSYSVASFQNWLSRQTGGRAFRMDTFHGALDITFFRLASSDAEMQSLGPFVVTEIERQLIAAGRTMPGKLYLVYYDGGSTYACGGAAWPPHVPGQVAAMYLKGTPGGRSCANAVLAGSPTQFPGYWEFAALHDLIHTLGVVPTNAPNHTTGFPGHVPEPYDLMYGGTAPWQIGSSIVIDAERNDYYGSAVPPGVTNLAGSPYLVDVLVSTETVAFQPSFDVRSPALSTLLPIHPPFELFLRREH